MSYYIYYRPNTGNILAVSNEQDDTNGKEFIEVEFETYRKFESGEYILHEWAVLASPQDENMLDVVQRVQEEPANDTYQTINQITKVKQSPDNVFVIEQDLENGSWSVSTTLDIKHMIYYGQSNYLEQQKQIFVIKEDNPNMLLDTLVIEFKDLLTTNKYNVKLYDKSVAKNEHISLICSRSNEEYVHIKRYHDNN